MPPPTELALDPKVFLAHGEAERAGGDRECEEDADGHMVQHRLETADAEPGRGDRREQDDGQCRISVWGVPIQCRQTFFPVIGAWVLPTARRTRATADRVAI